MLKFWKLVLVLFTICLMNGFGVQPVWAGTSDESVIAQEMQTASLRFHPARRLSDAPNSAPDVADDFSPAPPYFGTNPSNSDIKAKLIAAGQKYRIPPQILFGIAFQESGWRQFRSDGRTVYHQEPDGRNGVGIMQMTISPSASDYARLCTDIDYNIDRGAALLINKWDATPVIGGNYGQVGREKLENWYYAVWAYNGFVCPNPNNYAPSVLSHIANGRGLWTPVSITAPNVSSCPPPPIANTPSPVHVDTDFNGEVDGGGVVVSAAGETFRRPISGPDIIQSFNSTQGAGIGYHTGVDYGTGYGLTVYATTCGKVASVTINGQTDHGLGNCVILEHTLTDGRKIYSLYAHMASISAAMSVGAVVHKSQVVGQIGGTGYGLSNRWPTHLHFELKNSPVLNNPSNGGPYWGYTPGPAQNYGWREPADYIPDNPAFKAVCPGSGGGGGGGGSSVTTIVRETDVAASSTAPGFWRITPPNYAQYWKDATDTGQDGHVLYTGTASDKEGNAGTWRPNLQNGGNYEVFAWIPRLHATSRSAKYQITHANGTATVTVNQLNYSDVWVSLGTYSFNSGSGGLVKLADFTGENYSLGRFVGFDTVKWVPQADNTAPVVTLTSGQSSGVVYHSAQRVQWTISDGSGSGIDRWDQAWDVDPGADNFNTSSGYLDLPEGSHVLHVHVKDRAGNSRDWTFGPFNLVTEPWIGRRFEDGGIDARFSNSAAANNELHGSNWVGAPFDNGGTAWVHSYGDGLIQDFNGGGAGQGAIMAKTGSLYAYFIPGLFWARYVNSGALGGPLGFPISDAYAYLGGTRQDFEGGFLATNVSALDLQVATQLAATASGTRVTLTWRDNSSGETGYKVERKRGVSGEWVGLARGFVPDQNRYVDENVEAGTYFYRVYAYKASVGNAPTGAEVQVMVTNSSALSAPTELSANYDAALRGVVLTWRDNATGESGYKVERRVAGSNEWVSLLRGFTPDQNRFVDMSVVPGTTYVYRVWAYRIAVANGPYSAEVQVTVANSLAAPSGLSASLEGGGTRVALTWSDNASGESGYKVERRVAGSSEWVGLLRGFVPDQTSFVDTSVVAGVTYSYRVYAYKIAVANGPYSNTATIAVPQSNIEAPSNLSARGNDTGTSVELAWRDNATGESGFKVERRVGSSGEWQEIARGTSPNQTRFVDTGLMPGTSYFYRVRAYQNAVASGPYSAVATVTLASGASSDVAALTVPTTPKSPPAPSGGSS